MLHYDVARRLRISGYCELELDDVGQDVLYADSHGDTMSDPGLPAWIGDPHEAARRSWNCSTKAYILGMLHTIGLYPTRYDHAPTLISDVCSPGSGGGATRGVETAILRQAITSLCWHGVMTDRARGPAAVVYTAA